MEYNFIIKGELKITWITWTEGKKLIQELNKGESREIFYLVDAGSKDENFVGGIGLNNGPWVETNELLLLVFEMLFNVLDNKGIDIYGILIILGGNEMDVRILQVTQRWEKQDKKEDQLRKHIEIFESKTKNYKRYDANGKVVCLETDFLRDQSLPPIFDIKKDY